ncbi:MAG: TonB-dependent receptor [Elusimicrobiota bacterium]
MKKVFLGVILLVGIGVLYAQETAVFIGLRKEVPVEKTAINITLISEDEIKNSDAKNVGEILENKTGIVEVSKYGTLGSQSELRIRSGGASAQQVLVMVDGRPVNDTSLGSANLTEIPSENIERIEILRGPASALYGANALGGVVNIITKKATAVKPKTEIGIAKGSFNTQNYKMNFTARPGKLNIFLSGGKNITDGFRNNSDYNATDLSAKIGYDFEKYGEFYLSNGFLTSKLGVPGTNNTPLGDWDNHKERATSSPNANQKDEKFYSQLEHKIIIANAPLKTNLYWDAQKRTYKDPDWFTNTVSEPENMGFNSQLEISNMVIGIDERTERFERTDNTVSTINKKRNNYAGFIQRTFEINKLSLTPGIRYDYNSSYKDSTNPRVAGVYKLTEKIKLSANIGTAFRAPTFEDLYSPYISWGIGDTQGNPDLKPEKSIGTDMGCEYKISESLLSKITLAYIDIQDLIEWKNVSTDATYDKYRPVNVGAALSRVCEFELENKISKNLSHNLNYTFLESWGKETGTYKVLQYTPKHRLNYSLDYLAPLKLHTKLGVEFTHKQIWEDYQYHKIPGHTTVNLRISRNILQSEVYISCENIFKKRYFARENYPLPGRTYSAGINLYLWD